MSGECDRCSEHIIDCRCDDNDIESAIITEIVDLLYDIFDENEETKLSILRCVMSGIYISMNCSTDQVRCDLQNFLNTYETTLNQMRDMGLTDEQT
jgi:hypothetical protein